MFPEFTPLPSFVGGLLIGVSALWVLASLGRIAGITGVVGGALFQGAEPSDRRWRVVFVAGLLVVGCAGPFLAPELVQFTIERSAGAVIVAGLLVGFGTAMGGGCTSGHGVCGLGRRSGRSLAATLTFMGAGVATAAVVTHLMGGAL